MMNNLKSLFLISSGAFSALPGIAIMATGLGVPPNQSAVMFGGIIEVIGVFVLLLLWLNRSRVKRLTIQKITRRSIALFVVFIISLACYVSLYNHLVVKHDLFKDNPVFYPLWSSGDLSSALEIAGGKYDAIARYGPDEMKGTIRSSSSLNLNVTTAILIIIYQSIFVWIILAFGFLGVKLSKPNTTKKENGIGYT